MQKLAPHYTDEKTGIAYTLVGDYYLPDFSLAVESEPQEEYVIGRYWRMRANYLKSPRLTLYSGLLTSGKLHEHLHEVEERAIRQVEDIVQHFAKSEGTDERLKAENQMRWVGLMNNYRHCAEEIVLKEVVFE
ncbi:MAG: TnpV protein [Oscillospiraceae bacterium]|nr:TnpV protein [Oscillospiraceae bacterium]